MARRQQEKSQQTMEELRNAAMALFADKGYMQTTVAEITRRAGYAKGSFYRHWDSKDTLLLQILEEKLSHYRTTRDQELKKAGDLRQVLRIIWDFLESIVSDRTWAKVFMEFTIHAARNPELRHKFNQRQYRLSESIFANLLKGHVPEDYPAEKMGALNTALFEGFMVHNALETGVLELKDIREAAVSLAMSSLDKNQHNEDDK